MTIQREYNLPNCKLVVEGFAPDGTETSARPPLSVVTHVECNLLGLEPPITGGRSLLDSLVPVVSNYAQEFLSGVPHPHSLKETSGVDQEVVRLERINPDLHRLTVQPKVDPAATNGHAAADAHGTIQLNLKTVQLFDLVEALDQLLADQQTVPDLAVPLAPISRQYAVTHEPVGKRVVPMAIGLTSLAAAAIALFFLPIPERRVEEPAAQESPAATTNAAAVPGASPAASPSPEAEASPSPEESPSPEAEVSPSPEESPSPDAEASPSPEESPSAAADGDLNEALTPNSEITDPAVVDRLQDQLRDRLDEAWTQGSDFPEELVYRVRAAENGDILGFRYVNDAAVQHMDKTPLRDLQYNSTGNDAPEASTEFRVVFTPEGAVQVSPWHGRPTQ